MSKSVLTGIRASRWGTGALAAIVVAAAAAGILGMTRSMRAEAPTTGVVALATISRRLELVGTVFPKQRVAVNATVGGRVLRTHVRRGDHVEAGQRLYELDGTRASREVVRKRIALERARLRFDQAKEQNGDSKLEALDVDQAELDLHDAVEAAAALVVRAPRAGVVIQMSLAEGDYASPAIGGGAPPHVVIADSADVVVEAEVDEFEAAVIKSGQAALVRTEATSGQVYEAVVQDAPVLRRARNGAVPASFTVSVVPTRPIQDAIFGMSAQIEVETAKAVNVPVVPLNALLQSADQDEVIIVNGSMRSVAPVVLGVSDNSVVQLVRGPSIGTRVMIGDEATLKSAVPTAAMPR